MHHFTHVPTRRRAGHNLPWLLCQGHFEQLPASEQALFVGCVQPSCGARQDDCERCPQPEPLARLACGCPVDGWPRP